MERRTGSLERVVTLVGVPVALALLTWLVTSVASLKTDVAVLGSELRTSVTMRLNTLESRVSEAEQRLRIVEFATHGAATGTTTTSARPTTSAQ